VKITKSRMKQIIKEEIQKALTEQNKPCRFPRMPLQVQGMELWPEDRMETKYAMLPKSSGGGFDPTRYHGPTRSVPQQVWYIYGPKGKKLLHDSKTTGQFMIWYQENGCALPPDVTIGRSYMDPLNGREVKVNATSAFPRQEDKPVELEREEDPPELDPIDIPPEGEEGTLAGGGGPGGCGPRPPLSKNWREKAWASSERKTFRAWKKCVRNAKSK